LAATVNAELGGVAGKDTPGLALQRFELFEAFRQCLVNIRLVHFGSGAMV